MNIFYLNHDVKTCAQYHCDKHVVKMILEYAQILSTAHRVLDGNPVAALSPTGRKKTVYVHSNDYMDQKLYGVTHINHPCSVWCRASHSNYVWLYKLFRALMLEYYYRYGKLHACDKLYHTLGQYPANITESKFTVPPLVMPDCVKVEGDAIASYRNYYITDKSSFATWKNRNVPEWFLNGTIQCTAS